MSKKLEKMLSDELLPEGSRAKIHGHVVVQKLLYAGSGVMLGAAAVSLPSLFDNSADIELNVVPALKEKMEAGQVLSEQELYGMKMKGLTDTCKFLLKDAFSQTNGSDLSEIEQSLLNTAYETRLDDCIHRIEAARATPVIEAPSSGEP